MKKFLLILALSVIFSKTNAQLAVWNYTSTPSNFNATSVDADATAAALVVSTGLLAYQASPSSIAVASWSTSSTFSESGKYYEISVSPKANKKLTITNFSFNAGRTTTGPAKIEAKYSTNGFATSSISVGVFDNTNTTTTSLTTFSTTLNVETSQTITFRIWGYDASSTGNFRINNIIVAGATSTLPISLTSFTAKPIDKTILLNWETSSENENDYFNIERSGDGKSFSKIGTRKGAGNSSVINTYSFTDDNPFAGTNYYRLVQYDYNGKSSTSETKAVDSKLQAAQVYISAKENATEVNVFLPNNTNAQFNLFDIAGRKIASQSAYLSKGANKIVFTESINPGIYFVSMTSEGSVINTKFAK